MKRARGGLTVLAISRLLFLLVWFLIAGTAVDAGAQTARTAVREQLSGDAQLAWDGAIELYEAGDYEGALVQFKRAYDVSKQPQVLFDVGLCLKNMARYSQAIAAWELELEQKAKLPRTDVKALEAAISTLRPFVSKLELNVDQAGAIVSVDGEEVGRTPLFTPVPINVGRRVLRVTKAPEYLPIERTVDVFKDTPVSLTLKLEPAVRMAEVTVSTLGAEGVTLFLDGRALGPTPFRGDVPTGSHTFAARAAGFRETLKTVTITQGQPLNLTMTLVKVPNEGKLRVVAEPADAQIMVDGRMGTGSWEGLLAAGGHELRVSRPGYEEHVTDVSLSPGQDRTLEVALSKSQSWVWWTVSLVAVVGGGAVAMGYLLQPTETSPVTGTLFPGTVSF